jgi:hypothetical protein
MWRSPVLYRNTNDLEGPVVFVFRVELFLNLKMETAGSSETSIAIY